MARWGMVIDLTRCIGCGACVVACKQEHSLPSGITWGRVLVGEVGEFPAVKHEPWPVLCNHCEEPKCVNVCPTGASSQREDGLVTIDYDKCIGCRYCVVACPFQARTYLAKFQQYFPGQGWLPMEESAKKTYQTGTVVKCTFCVERIDAGIKKGLKPGIDREAIPVCVNICTTKARTFGDLDDPNSTVSHLIVDKHGIQNHPEYGTDPSVYYVR
ncbi:MAG: 4Fe-4S dicluster domain-containing protein [Chloroflexota bacterium]